MSQDLRLYSFVLAIVLLLWVAPVRADYGGTGCPVLAVPVILDDGDVWHYEDEEDEDNWADYRDLYPYNGTSADVTDSTGDWEDCAVEANSGTYYDGANHLWVLDDDLTCNFVWPGDEGDFRAGYDY